MKILIVSKGHPTTKYPLYGIFAFDQAKALVKAGHEVIFASVDMRSVRKWRKWGCESLERDGVRIESVNIPCSNFSKVLWEKTSVRALQFLWKRIRKKFGTPDIIHAHFIQESYLTAKVFAEESIPLVMTEHYSGMNKENIDSFLYKLGEFTYKRMDAVIAVSNSLAHNIKRLFNVEVVVIPNVVDLDLYKYLYHDSKKTGFIFISVGNLVPVKRMDALIGAFSTVFADDINVSLIIVGDGPERSRLSGIIKDAGMEARISLAGYLSREEISLKMRGCDCFVLVSESETFGVALIEALAAGLPVIATSCGGPADFVDESNGLLLPVNDANALQKALLSMYDKISSYDNQRISDDVVRRFSPETIAKSLVEIYKWRRR